MSGERDWVSRVCVCVSGERVGSGWGEVSRVCVCEWVGFLCCVVCVCVCVFVCACARPCPCVTL